MQARAQQRKAANYSTVVHCERLKKEKMESGQPGPSWVVLGCMLDIRPLKEG